MTRASCGRVEIVDPAGGGGGGGGGTDPQPSPPGAPSISDFSVDCTSVTLPSELSVGEETDITFLVDSRAEADAEVTIGTFVDGQQIAQDALTVPAGVTGATAGSTVAFNQSGTFEVTMEVVAVQRA